MLDGALRAHEKVTLMKALKAVRRCPKTDLLEEGCGPWGWQCGCGREHRRRVTRGEVRQGTESRSLGPVGRTEAVTVRGRAMA